MTAPAAPRLGAGLLIAGLWTGAAQATLIENGGFEDALLGPWSCFDEAPPDRLCAVSPSARSGDRGLIAYHNQGGGILEQLIPTVPGAAYAFSAWSATVQDTPANALAYSLDGGPFVQVPRTADYARTTDTFTAAGAITPIRFFIKTEPLSGAWRLDDISVSLLGLPPDLPSLVVNGGFEDGDLGPWTCVEDIFAEQTCRPLADDPRTGAAGLIAFQNGAGGILEQVIPTAPGAAYDFSAWTRTTQQNPANVLRYSLDGGPFVEVAGTPDYASVADVFTASGTDTPIRFFFRTEPGSGAWRLDDIAVSLRSLPPAPPQAAVPAPLSAPLLAGGLAALWALRRRRRGG